MNLSWVCVLLLVLPLTAAGSSGPPALYGVDALGRAMPGPADVRPFRRDRYVGIFYFLWQRLDRVYDNSQILKNNPDAQQTNASPPWGPAHAFHFWGEPMFGYYRSDDPWVLRRHATLLSDAGVDFLVFDTTNAVIYEDVVLRLCEVLEQQRQAGDPVPQIAFMVNTQAGRTAQRIYELFYKLGRYPELWFRWQGKPLLICDPAEASQEVADFFTLRKAHWPFELVNTHNAWHWEATYPQVYSYDRDASVPEQVNVSVGQNLHQKTGRVEMMSTGWARGRSFHDGRLDDRPQSYAYGLNFGEQWQRALDLDPNVVFVTGWNEWIAMQLNTGQGPVIFCDQFNPEFSRDVEMMKGGYGDNYYMQMAASIRRFKGMTPTPQASADKTIDLSGPFSQWDDVRPVYRDHGLDTQPRDFPGCGDNHYIVCSGRNDFRVLQVARDDQNIYFYAQTEGPITAPSNPNWMWLLLHVDGTTAANWEGFDFRVNGHVCGAGKTSVEACRGGWQWRQIGTAAYRVEGRQLHVAVSRQLLGIRPGSFAIEFKWIDSARSPGDILNIYVDGDAAPDGRFRYRHEVLPSGNDKP